MCSCIYYFTSGIAVALIVLCIHCCLQTAAVRSSTGMHDVNNAAIENKMKCWLRQACDRDGDRQRRFEASEARKRQCLSQGMKQPPFDDDI